MSANLPEDFPIALLQVREQYGPDDPWNTERAFIGEDEAREYARNRSYLYGTESETWRVHVIPCAGELATLLAAVDASPTLAAAFHERLRQIIKEGFDARHDDAHALGEIERAGISYMQASGMIATHGRVLYRPRAWPWEARWWKPAACAFRNRVKGIALLCAEGDAQLRRQMNSRSNATRDDSSITTTKKPTEKTKREERDRGAQ